MGEGTANSISRPHPLLQKTKTNEKKKQPETLRAQILVAAHPSVKTDLKLMRTPRHSVRVSVPLVAKWQRELLIQALSLTPPRLLRRSP